MNHLEEQIFKVSIITPIYNMERLLPKCIQCSLNQTYKNIEVLLIDDGSTDRSGSICDKYADLDDRIKVIHQENKGIAGAINAGLDNLSGDYLLFVDSDDYIAPEMVERLMELLIENQADIVQCDRYSFPLEKGIPFSDQSGSLTIFDSRKDILADFFNYGKISRNLAARIFDASLFEDVRCEQGRQIVDVVTLPQLLEKCNKYVITSEKYYYVYEAPTSMSRSSFTYQRWDDSQYAMIFFEKFIREKCPEFIEYIYFRHVDAAIYNYCSVSKNMQIKNREEIMKKSVQDFRLYYKRFISTDYYKGKGRKYRRKIELFKRSPELCRVYCELENKSIVVARKIKYRIASN